MAAYPLDSTLDVRPFTQRREGDEVVVADSMQRVFLAIPADGLFLLESLAAGHTVGETVRRYEDKYHETPDINEFLDDMVLEGFVCRPGDPVELPHDHAKPFRYGWSMDWISPAVARRLASAPVVVACLAVAVGAVALIIDDPGVVPPSTVFLFADGYFNLFTLITFAVTLVAVWIHELAHAVVARAAGVPVTLGFGNLLFSLVAQTDVSGLWMGSRRRRYLTYVSGAIVDGVFAAGFIFVLWADRNGVFDVPQVIVPLLGALFMTYEFRLLFQTNFAIKTDVYYLIADAFRCRDLMGGTETMLRNVVYRLFGKKHLVVDQSSVPPRERRVLRGYAVAWIVGRLIAFWALFFLFVPVMWGIVEQFGLLVLGKPALLGWIDFLTVAVLVMILNGGGIAVWVTSIYQGRQRRRARRQARADGRMAARAE